ncbi:hypothetical protein GOV07_03630 [Candidatus Woesearchaeota archaeon]|nr:hypothetical protein [Candidatus Woesearchaeota archaeon]
MDILNFFLGTKDFFTANKWTFIFYAAVVYLIYANREKLDWQAKFIGLYRTKVGLKLMERLGKHERFFKVFGYIGVIVGFIGMLLITILIFKGVYDFFFIPEAPPTVYPALPGISVPGIGKIPLVTGWIALFIVIVIHEFSHGVVSRAHKIPVKSSGLVVFGPLGGAFVEPDEKKLQKSSAWTRQSVFAAGPFSNIVSGLLFFLIILFVMAPIAGSMTNQFGVQPVSIFEGTGAADADLPTGVTVTMVNHEPVMNMYDLSTKLSTLIPGEIVVLTTSTGDEHDILAGPHPDDETKAYLGAQFSTVTEPKIDTWWYRTLIMVVGWLSWLFLWTYFFSLGIGLANLLPIAITDGGRMFQIITNKFWGKKRGNLIWMRVGSVVLIIIVLLLIGSIGKQIF